MGAVQQILAAQKITGGSSPLLTDLISSWELANVNDSHGSNTLTNNGTVTFGAGLGGTCADFEKDSTQYLSIADNASLSMGADTPFTLECWVYAESFVGGTCFISKGDANGPSDAYVIDYTPGGSGVRFYVGNGSTFGSVSGSNAGDLSTATTYQIIVWHDAVGDTLNIRINNGTPNFTVWAGGTQNEANEFILGAIKYGGSPVNLYDGLMRCARLWKRILTSGEQDTLWNGGTPLPYSSF